MTSVALAPLALFLTAQAEPPPQPPADDPVVEAEPDEPPPVEREIIEGRRRPD